MGIYLTPEFQDGRSKARITDTVLCKAARSIFAGLYGDHLGRFTYKKRLGLPGVGASDGARCIVFFNDGKNIYFFDMYLKSQLSKKKGKELEDDEIDAYCKIARDFIAMPDELIETLAKAKELIEVTCND